MYTSKNSNMVCMLNLGIVEYRTHPGLKYTTLQNF